MKNLMLKVGIMALFAILIVGCANQKEDSTIPETIEPLPLPELLMLSDEMATFEQLDMKKKLERIFIYKTEARDNRMYLSVGSDYFVENGIPVEYYNMMQAQCDANNAFMEECVKNLGENDVDCTDLAANIEQNKKDYEEYLATVGKDGISYQEYRRKRCEEKYKEVMGLK